MFNPTHSRKPDSAGCQWILSDRMIRGVWRIATAFEALPDFTGLFAN